MFSAFGDQDYPWACAFWARKSKQGDLLGASWIRFIEDAMVMSQYVQ